MICGDDAAFTKRIEQNEHRLELIGGADTYLASCRDCFEKKGSYALKLAAFYFQVKT